MSAAMTPLELACGIVLGADEPDRWLGEPPQLGPLAALEAAVLPALLRPPCLVSFSGGRDSAIVLAVATALARREGLPDPVPATNRFAGAPAADEVRWQQLAVTALSLSDWEICHHTDELDAIGPYAQRIIRRHGLLWPFNVHFHLPLLDAARGGSLLTGIGGDELFAAARRTRLTAVRTLQVRPERRDAGRIALALAPAWVRRRVLERRVPVDFPWLRPAAARAVTRDIATSAAAEPRGLGRRMRWYRGLRYVRTSVASLDAPALAGDVQIIHPLAGRDVWRAVEGVAAPHGFADRTAAIRRLFGHLLPVELVERPGKASFDEVFFSRHARAFAAQWSGAGVPDTLVDVAALRDHWQSAAPLPQSFSLLQAAWWATVGGRDSAPDLGDGAQEPISGFG